MSCVAPQRARNYQGNERVWLVPDLLIIKAAEAAEVYGTCDGMRQRFAAVRIDGDEVRPRIGEV